MKKLIYCITIFLLAACQNDHQPTVGADQDSHGCKASAGYLWCEKTQQCERPWELSKKMSFENNEQAFKAFCSAP